MRQWLLFACFSFCLFPLVFSLSQEAADRKASLVALPENFLFLGSSFPVSLAEPIPGPSVQKFQEIARDLSISILMGSILEKVLALSR
jgi:predicted amidohydrolase